MAVSRGIAAILLALCSCGAHAAAGPIVVTGATGRTGALIYGLLKGEKANVRALVRNASKAKEVLNCSACDQAEGIFVGDITKAETLVDVMQGAAALVIVTSAVPICDPFPKCHFPEGAAPVDVDWKAGSVVLISTMGTTAPDSSLDVFGHISFYKLNFEATLMASGLPFTIVKPCGLNDDAAGARELLVGHDDEMSVKPPMIPRADVARVAVAALQRPALSAGLRFDLCSKDSATPTSDEELPKVLEQAHYHWGEPRAPGTVTEAAVVV